MAVPGDAALFCDIFLALSLIILNSPLIDAALLSDFNETGILSVELVGVKSLRLLNDPTSLPD
jgi:hypothetical protein